MIRTWRSRPRHIAGLAMVVALVAAACSGTDAGEVTPTTSTSTSTSAAPTTVAELSITVDSTTTSTTTTVPPDAHGGEVVVVLDQEPPTLNRFVAGEEEAVATLIGQGYLAGVQEIDGSTLELIPELVTELPTVANGGLTVNPDDTMTVRYNIREEAVWSDGTPISGEDFQFTLDTILDRGNPTDKAVYENIVDSSFTAKTFEYTLATPTREFEGLFDAIIPKHAVAGTNFNWDWNDTMWPSAGPFVFAEWKRGEFIRLERNENYWKSDPVTGDQLPFLDSVIFTFIPEVDQAVNAFQAREVDVIQPPPDAAAFATLLTLEGEGAAVSTLPGPVWEHLNFQFGENRLERNSQSANSNLNFRKAVAHAIDKQLIVDELLEGQLRPLDSFVDMFAPTLSQESWSQYDYDPDKARTFAEAAKNELGVDSLKVVFTTTSDSPIRVEVSELLVAMFNDVGIEYENQLENSQIFIGETLDFGNWDLGAWAWGSAPGFTSLIDFFELVDPEAPPPSGSNFYRWGTPEVGRQSIRAFNQGPSSVVDENTARFAEIRDLLNETVDETEIKLLIAEAENILAAQVVFIPLYARMVTAAIWADEVGGFEHNPTSAGFTWNIESWYRLDQ